MTLYTTVTTNLTGWRLEDAAHHRFSLSGVIQVGQRYVVPNPGRPVWNRRAVGVEPGEAYFKPRLKMARASDN